MISPVYDRVLPVVILNFKWFENPVVLQSFLDKIHHPQNIKVPSIPPPHDRVRDILPVAIKRIRHETQFIRLENKPVKKLGIFELQVFPEKQIVSNQEIPPEQLGPCGLVDPE
jgi:hypothetical protein